MILEPQNVLLIKKIYVILTLQERSTFSTEHVFSENGTSTEPLKS